MGFWTTAAIIAGSMISAGATIYSGEKAANQADKARKDMENKSNAALKAAEAEKANAASQAQESVLSKQRARAGSQSVFTSPLGMQGEASIAKKTLLGQ